MSLTEVESPGAAPRRTLETPLALWLDRAAISGSLSPTTVRRLVETYTDPGDLILTDRASTAAEARSLGRLATVIADSGRRRVARLPLKPATLTIIEQATADRGTTLAAAATLAMGGFLALATPGLGTSPTCPLSALVRAGREAGLQYWQHIVVVNADMIETRQRDGGSGGRLARAHRDLLIFRQPTDLSARAAAAQVRRALVAA